MSGFGTVLRVGFGFVLAGAFFLGFGRDAPTGAYLHWGATIFNTHLAPALLAGPMAGARPGKEK